MFSLVSRKFLAMRNIVLYSVFEPYSPAEFDRNKVLLEFWFTLWTKYLNSGHSVVHTHSSYCSAASSHSLSSADICWTGLPGTGTATSRPANTVNQNSGNTSNTSFLSNSARLMPGSLQILVTSFLVFSSFWLRDFLYFKFPFCLSCFAQ